MHAGNWALLLWLYQFNILLGFECFVHTLRSGVADYIVFLNNQVGVTSGTPWPSGCSPTQIKLFRNKLN